MSIVESLRDVEVAVFLYPLLPLLPVYLAGQRDEVLVLTIVTTNPVFSGRKIAFQGIRYYFR